ncbi:MAG: HTH domain-containing protein [Sphingobacteriales bacterium]|nr:MAG: HTH domain-containing protein [Sphingobacteriales bacterium]
MKLLHQIERINLLHQLIVKANTHTPCVLAKRLNISVSRLYAIIDELKEMGAPIYYCRTKCTYFYAYPYQINISINFMPLSALEQKSVNGGCFNNLFFQSFV